MPLSFLSLESAYGETLLWFLPGSAPPFLSFTTFYWSSEILGEKGKNQDARSYMPSERSDGRSDALAPGGVGVCQRSKTRIWSGCGERTVETINMQLCSTKTPVPSPIVCFFFSSEIILSLSLIQKLFWCNRYCGSAMFWAEYFFVCQSSYNSGRWLCFVDGDVA